MLQRTEKREIEWLQMMASVWRYGDHGDVVLPGKFHCFQGFVALAVW